MSVDLSWTVERESGVRFVACRVHNAGAVSRCVRVRNRIDGPILPPRRSGVPEEGWDATGVTLRLEPDERRGVGFAVVGPADESVADPPVEIADARPIDGDEEPTVTAAAAVRSLGEHRPPRDALVGSEPTDPPAVNVDLESDSADATDEVAGAVTGVSSPDGGTTPPIEDDGSGDRDARLPPGSSRAVSIGSRGLEDRLDRAERRIERAERLTDADLATATDAVEHLGGVTGVATLAERVADDAAALRRLSERASSLAARAEATDVPTEALERLA
ncbi:DUF7857 domain-containing protein [Halorubrum cibi]|uniref:DUF8080 domain-containing protein n=1 Tax=Halorubrum cibi TaxID=413815 RepID=A0A521CGZ6_9EURY|nr:hypothetical protein [Halorubrum cibi]SMO58682.1 hypothetical protein SAMN06264867_104187 [Halorubrum cibi]